MTPLEQLRAHAIKVLQVAQATIANGGDSDQMLGAATTLIKYFTPSPEMPAPDGGLVIADDEAVVAYAAALNDAAEEETFYIDCEFDGHSGPLISIAMVRQDGRSLHVEVADLAVKDPWVLSNVVPILGAHRAEVSCRVNANEVGQQLRLFIGDCQTPTIIADSPVDIGRFCRAISTAEDGCWASTNFPGMKFIVRNVNCYPTTLDGAVQHNAWWDAMALRAMVTPLALQPKTLEQALAGMVQPLVWNLLPSGLWKAGHGLEASYVVADSQWHHPSQQDAWIWVEGGDEAAKAAAQADHVRRCIAPFIKGAAE